MKKIVILLLCLLGLILLPQTSWAIEDPLLVPNNRFGIHIIDESDLDDAAKLVNSSGGDWGYVTLVIREDQRNHSRWQKVFDKMRRLHLIPIVRIATQMETNGWKGPSYDDLDSWVTFLDSLNWVVKNRYVVVGNEPNHAKEWGGDLDPEGYATYLKTFSQRLKDRSKDFYILPAGLDASAPNARDGSTMDESDYLDRMLKKEPDLFDHIDGWTSHSYPNPHFSGAADGVGKGSVRTYLWELNYLRQLGLNKQLPVFITETGWTTDNTEVSQKLKIAYENAWNSPQVVAVTPFILNYQDPLFGLFSWKRLGGDYHDFYFEVQKMPKVKGTPVQESRGQILSVFLPILIEADKPFYVTAVVENTGQSIWTKEDTTPSISNILTEDYSFRENIEPSRKSVIFLKAIAPRETGSRKEKLLLYRDKLLLSTSNEFDLTILEIPKVDNFLQGLLRQLSAIWQSLI